jgi:hypothetical protein
MHTEYCIELLCRAADIRTFARLGFQTITTTAEPATASAPVRLARLGVDDAIVTSLVDLRLQGQRFAARIVEIDVPVIPAEVEA